MAVRAAAAVLLLGGAAALAATDEAPVFITDAFLYNGDSVVDLRVRTMFDVVDHVFVVESWYTFAGERKPFLYVERNRAVFEPYLASGKLDFVVVESYPLPPPEFSSRSALHTPAWWR
jgi:hypothetical protein